MKTGDIVTDSRAAAWTLTSLLGEGTWSRTWLVRDDGGRTRILRTPYEASDLPPASADRVPLMRKVADEQAEALAQGEPHLVQLEDRIVLPNGATALLLPHFPTTLERQLSSGIPLVQAIEEVLAAATALAASGKKHGNLRPSNILIDPAGQPQLSDPLTPTLETLLPGADRNQPSRKRWAPVDRVGSDTWSLCSALYTAVMLDESGGDVPAEIPAPPATGLDKVVLATVRDHAAARFRRDGANPRFMHRTAEKLATVLARGLSAQADPSPPYRFLTAKDLRPRLEEVAGLIRPGIDNVGRLLLSSAATGDVFQAPTPVGFTVSVAPTAGVSDADDLLCGVRLTDLDAAGDGRVPLEDAQFGVDRHPSGRLRFSFTLPEVAPGRYAVRVAFSVKDSGDEPAIVEGGFHVRPPPGYVPPVQPDAEPPPLTFSPAEPPAVLTPVAASTGDEDSEWEEDEEDAATVLMSGKDLAAAFETDPNGTDPDSLPGGELIEAFPRPLAPTSPGTAVERNEPISEPVHSPAPVVTPVRPSLQAVPTPPPSEPGSEYTDPAPTAPSAPPSLTVAPSIAPPEVSDVGVPAPPPVMAAPPVLAAPTLEPSPAPAPIGSEDPAWNASQAGEAEFFQPGDGLPGGGEDLMGDSPSALDGVWDALSPYIQRDSPYIPFLAIVGCLFLILVAFAALRSC